MPLPSHKKSGTCFSSTPNLGFFQRPSTRRQAHVKLGILAGHIMASDLCTLSVQTIGQITVHFLFGPVSHIPDSFPRNTQAWQAPVRPKESLVRRRPRTYMLTCTRLWEMSMGPTIHHQPSSSGPRPPGGTRPLNPSDRNPPRLAPRRTQRDHLTPPRRRPRRLPLARTLPPRAPRSTPVRLSGACWRRSSWPTSKRR
jgi:hypothetical protein